MFWTRTYIDDDRRCSFCRKPEAETGELISSPGTPLRYICEECVAVCNSILKERGADLSRPDPGPGDNQYPLSGDRVITVRYSLGRKEPGS